MSLSEKLETLQKGDDSKKYPIRDLTDSKGYKILNARRVDTRFKHPCILLEIELDDEEIGVTFLPNRFVNALTDEDLQAITEAETYRVRCVNPEGISPEVLVWNENDSGKGRKRITKK